MKQITTSDNIPVLENFFLNNIINAFDSWYAKDQHSLYVDYYQDIISLHNIKSMSDDESIHFFYEFITVGGMVQSGGERTKERFKASIRNQITYFRSFILEPFSHDFNIKSWFKRIEKFKYFGIGIATIYLNRVDSSLFPILNNKTLKSLRSLGYDIPMSKSFLNYQRVQAIQKDLISKFPSFSCYYKVDSFNEFVVGSEVGNLLVEKYRALMFSSDIVEQLEIENTADVGYKTNDCSALYLQIKSLERNKDDYIDFKGKRYKRNNYLMYRIKEYHDFTCQFCQTKIKKKNGKLYVEACHIKPKSEGGRDSIDNILVLCPNCHKRFDYAKRIGERRTDDKYEVTLNGVYYMAKLK